MIDRDELRQELILREHIRSAIKIVKRRKNALLSEEKKNELQLREIIRDLLSEGQSAVASVARHDSTGINALEDLLRNSNVLFVIETGYKSLTTRTKEDPPTGQTKQRRSYENHILSAVKKSLAPEESRKEAGEDVEITEDIDIDIADKPEDDPDFINVAEEEVEEVEVDEKEEFGLSGEDKTGRNRAFTDFGKIEKDILTAFDDLDNPEDLAMFEEYLIKNLALYFEKYENELDDEPEAPLEAADAEPDPLQADLEGEETEDLEGEETEAPEFELQEVLQHLDLDDIIKNLL
tara:strand:- start:63712 stop:64590 length:879 start_codon:yes stop_codon:yes gene_type:complete